MKQLIKKFLILSGFCFAVIPAFSQSEDMAVKYAGLITEEGLRDKLTILASDALEGRMTGTRGQKMAAAFIEHHFREIGLKGPVNGSYMQEVPLTQITPGQTYILADNERFENFRDFFFPGILKTDGVQSAPLVFAGKGTEEEISQLNISNKAVLLLLPDLKIETVFSSGKIIKSLKEKGALAVILAPEGTEQEFDGMNTSMKEWFGRGALVLQGNIPGGLNAFVVRPSIAEKLLRTSYGKLKDAAAKNQIKKVKENRLTWSGTYASKEIKSENVLGFLEGSDKKDELIIVTAHFDHIGINEGGPDKVNNGADDDGSGTSAVMQLAEAFAEAKKNGNGPRRSILFMTVTGEEEGLFGSEWYVTHPVFPMEKNVVNLNIDMIGRTDPTHKADRNYVYAIGSDKLSEDLHRLHEQVNTTYTKLSLDYTYNDQNHPEQLYYRSDHWNFAKNNIPIIFYFDGIHEDYHKPSDEVSKIEFDILRKRTQLVFHTAWTIANRETGIEISGSGK